MIGALPVLSGMKNIISTIGLLGFMVWAQASSGTETLTVSDGELLLDWQARFSASDKAKIRHWLQDTVSTVSLMNANLPRRLNRIEINRAYFGNGPVPRANTIRRRHPEGISFHVNPEYSLAEFNQDWTAAHEFSHLYIPYPGQADIWISEGFASYYQNVLMARAGKLSEQQVSEKLARGFRRGEKDPNQNIKLVTLSEKMRQRRGFMRVYWSGALYFLRMDLRLRASGSSLDEIITEFNACCRQQYRRWNGTKFVRALDEIHGENWFSAEFNRFENQTAFPEFIPTLARLGIQMDADKVTLSADPASAALRQAIFRPHK